MFQSSYILYTLSEDCVRVFLVWKNLVTIAWNPPCEVVLVYAPRGNVLIPDLCIAVSPSETLQQQLPATKTCKGCGLWMWKRPRGGLLIVHDDSGERWGCGSNSAIIVWCITSLLTLSAQCSGDKRNHAMPSRVQTVRAGGASNKASVRGGDVIIKVKGQ